MEFLFLSQFMIHSIHKNNIVIYLFRYLYNNALVDKRQYWNHIFIKMAYYNRSFYSMPFLNSILYLYKLLCRLLPYDHEYHQIIVSDDLNLNGV